MTTTIRQFSNALISSDKIHISGFTSDYVFNDGGTTTCTVTSNSNQISSTTSTDTSGTNRILIVTLTGSITNGNVDTIITCNNIDSDIGIDIEMAQSAISFSVLVSKSSFPIIDIVIGFEINACQTELLVSNLNEQFRTALPSSQ